MTKKITFYLIALLVVVLGGYVVYENFFNGPNQAPATNDQQSNSQSSDNQSQNGNTQSNGGSQQGSKYKDGQYTGEVTDAVYGPMQVKAIISGGKITDIQFLQYPNQQGHTLEVSNQSLPVLKSEAIKAQSANVDIVSGATQTSEGFIQSLASALSKAS